MSTKLVVSRDVSTSVPLRAVLDSNILCRFVLTPEGFSSKLYRALAENRWHLVTSEAILAEVIDVLHRKHANRKRRISDAEVEDLVDAARQMATVVPGRYEVFVVTKDPKDNPILACALEGHADFLVTDDKKHLLPLKHYRRIQIVSVPGFLRELARS